jgi:hypothetical protein
MSTRNLLRGKGRLARKAENLTAICEPIVSTKCVPLRLKILQAFMVCYRDSFTMFNFYNCDFVQSFHFAVLSSLFSSNVISFSFLHAGFSYFLHPPPPPPPFSLNHSVSSGISVCFLFVSSYTAL